MKLVSTILVVLIGIVLTNILVDWLVEGSLNFNKGSKFYLLSGLIGLICGYIIYRINVYADNQLKK